MLPDFQRTYTPARVRYRERATEDMFTPGSPASKADQMLETNSLEIAGVEHSLHRKVVGRSASMTRRKLVDRIPRAA